MLRNFKQTRSIMYEKGQRKNKKAHSKKYSKNSKPLFDCFGLNL